MYGFSFSITNLSSRPIAIDNNGEAIIKVGKNKYPIDMKLAIEDIQDDKTIDIDYPLAINSGETKIICWITKKCVSESDYSDGILSAHKQKSSQF